MPNNYEIVYCDRDDCINNVHSKNGNICLALTEKCNGDCPFFKRKGETVEETIARIKKAMSK